MLAYYIWQFVFFFHCCLNIPVAQEFKDMLQAVMSKMSERVALPEPERLSRGRVLSQGLRDAYKPKIIKSFDLEWLSIVTIGPLFSFARIFLREQIDSAKQPFSLNIGADSAGRYD